MAGLWCLYRHWQPVGHRYQPHPHVVYVYFAADAGLTHHRLCHTGFLDEYKAVHAGGPKKPLTVFVSNFDCLFCSSKSKMSLVFCKGHSVELYLFRHLFLDDLLMVIFISCLYAQVIDSPAPAGTAYFLPTANGLPAY